MLNASQAHFVRYIYALGQTTISEWYWQFHVYWFHRNMDPAILNKAHKVYPTYLLEKLNTSNEIKSFPYLNMQTKLSILFYWNICHVIKDLQMHEYVVIHYRSSYLVQLSGKLHTIRHNELNIICIPISTKIFVQKKFHSDIHTGWAKSRYTVIIFYRCCEWWQGT